MIPRYKSGFPTLAAVILSEHSESKDLLLVLFRLGQDTSSQFNLPGSRMNESDCPAFHRAAYGARG
jgi:hypothetical protein